MAKVFRITQPRRQVLQLLVDFVFLATTDFYEMLPRSSRCASHERAVRRLLLDFTTHGYLRRSFLVDHDRSERFVYYKHVYWPSSRGLELAQEEGIDNGQGKANDEHSPRTLEHEYEITRFHIALQKAAVKTGYDLYWRQNDLKKTVNPDALFALGRGEEEFYYFLEVEKSKSGKYMKGEPQIVRKLLKYYEYYNSADCLSDWEAFKQFRVIVIVRTEERRRNLLRRLSELCNSHVFWVTTEELCRTSLVGAIFHTPSDPNHEAYSLCP